MLSRRDFGTFAFWQLPLRINYCGRRYYPGTAQGSPASLMKAVAGHPRWQTVGHTFSLRQINAPVSPPTNYFSVCAMCQRSSNSLAVGPFVHVFPYLVVHGFP